MEWHQPARKAYDQHIRRRPRQKPNFISEETIQRRREEAPFIVALKQIQKIPIVDDLPAPQARIHKLLLAYYFILSSDYNSARELLNPSSSLHQNESFNIEELEILSWIIDIDSDALEVTALKLVAVIHFNINESKFPLDYKDKSQKTEDIIACINNPSGILLFAFKHLLSLRELSEKYYIYRIFPEVLREPLLTRIFGSVHTIMNPILHSNGNPNSNILLFSTDKAEHKLGDIMDSKTFSYYYNLDRKHYDKAKVETMMRLMHKGNESTMFLDRVEIMVYCLISRPEIFESLRNTPSTDPLFSNFEKKVENKCRTEFEKYFRPINQSQSMTKTSLDILKYTMTEDLRRVSIVINSNSNPSKIDMNLVAKEVVEFMKLFKENLEKLIKNDTGSSGPNSKLFEFNTDAKLKSKILGKLTISIDNFMTEKGKDRLNEITLSDQLLNDFNSLDQHLNDKLDQFSNHQNEAINELALLTNSQVYSSAINSVISLMHRKKTKTFKSLYSCYLKNDQLACIQRKFPQLSLNICLKLKDSAFLFFSRQILIDYFKMLKNTSAEFVATKGPISVEDLTLFCDELAKIEKFNERVIDPVIMNFEFRSGKYRLRTEQVDDIGKLTKLDSKTNLFQSIVIQRMMAAGKTLVLGTISIVKKAMDQLRLSILVPPSSLYQSNTTSMQARTYQYFKKKGRNFSFPRFNLPVGEHAVLVKQYLKTIIDLMKDSMLTQNYLILSPDTLHSYLNSYIEVLLNAEDRWKTDHYQDILRLYSEIYRIFKTRSSIILDEIDMTMDPRKELNFPTQETEPYNMIAAALLADIMEFLVFDDAVINAGLDIHSNNQASLTSENYNTCRALVLKYIEGQFNSSNSIWYKFIFNGTNHGKPAAEFMQFLNNSDMEHEKVWITNLHSSGYQIIANSLIIVKSQLYQYMEDSLKGTVNQNFGTAGSLRPEIKYAVPYVAANTPSPASVFADRWETLLKTLLMVSASPCSFDIAKEFIIYAKKTMSNETAGITSMSSTTTYKNLKLVAPSLDPTLLDEKNNIQVEIIQNALSIRSPAAIRLLFSYYMNEVFRKMTFPTEQVTSNALHMTSMFGSVQGYSGTIDNVNILPQCVIVDAYEDHEKNEKNNGGISLKLVSDCNDKNVPELSNDSFKKTVEEMVKDLLGLYTEDIISNVSAIIDTGAFFKNFKNRQVAEAVLSVTGSKFEAGLYYDEDSNQLEFVRKSGSSFTRGFLDTTDPDDIKKATQADLSKRFTFYDQRHITGSDILQPKTAHALMTAGPRVLLRDILQGTLRMRQFMTSQKVHLVTTGASRLFYYSKVNVQANHSCVKVSDILALGALNEDDKQATENEKLAFTKIGVEIRGFVLDEISRILTDSPNISGKKGEIVGLFNCAKVIFLRSISEDPLSWLQRKEMKGTAEALKAYAIALLSPICNLLTKNKNDICKRFNLVKHRIKEMIDENRKECDSLVYYLGGQINSRIQSENGNEVQMQTLTLTLIDLNMDQLIDQINGSRPKADHEYTLLTDLNTKKNDNEFNTVNINFVSFHKLFDLHKCIRSKNNANQTPLLDAALLTQGRKIGITRDLIELVKVNENGNRFPIFSKYTLEGSHLLVQNDNQIFRVLLISPKHASDIYDQLRGKTPVASKSKFWLCNLSGFVTATNVVNYEIGQNILKIFPEAQNLIFDVLIFNGSLSQIFMNPILKNIYENIWLKADNFKERATFLLLRMKLLLEKDSIMFEDDDVDLSNLKKYAMGDKNPALKGNLSEGYPKTEVDGIYNGERIDKLKLNSPALAPSGKTKNLNFNLSTEISKLFHFLSDAIKKVVPAVSYILSSGTHLDDTNIDNTAEALVAISAENPINLPYILDDKVTAAVKKVAPVKTAVNLMSDIDVGPNLFEKDPNLTPFTSPLIKNIIVDQSSLNDNFDFVNPDVKIEELLDIEIDSNDKSSPDEDINDVFVPIVMPEIGGGGGGGGEVEQVIIEESDDDDHDVDAELNSFNFGSGSGDGKNKNVGNEKGEKGKSTPNPPSASASASASSSSSSSPVSSTTTTSSSSASSPSASTSSSVILIVGITAVIFIIGALVGFFIYSRKSLKVKSAVISDEKKIEMAVQPPSARQKYEYFDEKKMNK